MLQLVHERHGVGSIPVVMFSGKVDERAADEAAERGAQGFIGKPFDPQRADRADEAAAADLIWLDRHLQRWVVHHRIGWLNALVVTSPIATDGLLFVIVGAVLAVLWRRPWFLVLLVAAALAADGLSLVLRQWIGRSARRSSTRSRSRSCTPHTGSFPSGHAATAFACATVLAWARRAGGAVVRARRADRVVARLRRRALPARRPRRRGARRAGRYSSSEARSSRPRLRPGSPTG